MNRLALISLGLAPVPQRSIGGRVINRDDVEPTPAPAVLTAEPAPKPGKTKAEKPIKRAGQKTQRLLHIITREGPITTATPALPGRQGHTSVTQLAPGATVTRHRMGD